jgi:hypothetical protein
LRIELITGWPWTDGAEPVTMTVVRRRHTLAISQTGMSAVRAAVQAVGRCRQLAYQT